MFGVAMIEIDYGDGLVKKFSPEMVRLLKKHLGIAHMTRSILREVTRQWATSAEADDKTFLVIR